MNLDQLQIPSTLSEIIALYKELKHICFENWCVLTYDDGHNAKLEFLKQIQNCYKSHDANNSVRACIGASILVHYSTSWIESLTTIFANLEAGNNSEATEFICMCVSKFTNKLPPGSPFIIQRLKNISKILTVSTSPSAIHHSTVMLKCLGKYAKRALESCALQFYENLQALFFCEKEEIRNLAFNTLYPFLESSRRADFPSNLYKESRSILDNISNATFPKIHGALLIFSVICSNVTVEFNPQQAATQMNLFWTFANGEFPSYIKHVSLLILVSLAPCNEQVYTKNYKDKVIAKLWPQKTFTLETADGLHFLIKHTPDLFETKASMFISTIKDVLTDKNKELAEVGVTLINEKIQKNPTKL